MRGNVNDSSVGQSVKKGIELGRRRAVAFHPPSDCSKQMRQRMLLLEPIPQIAGNENTLVMNNCRSGEIRVRY